MTNTILTGTELPLTDIKEVRRDITTLEGILGDDKPDIEDPLGLLTATVDVRVFESQESLYYRVSFPGTAFYGKEFIHLLTGSIPNNPDLSGLQGRGGIKDDWNILDDIAKNEERVKRHEGSLGKYWSEFSDQHRIPFMNSVLTASPGELKEFFEEERKKIITMDQLILIMPGFIINRMAELQGGTKKYFLSCIYGHLQEYLGNLNPKISRDKFTNMDPEDIYSIIAQLPRDKMEKFARQCGPLHTTIVRINSEPEQEYLSRLVEMNFSIATNGHENVAIRSNESYALFRFEDGQFKEFEHSYGSITDDSPNALSPLIIWGKNKEDGKRVYLSSKTPQVLTEDIDKRSNPLEGIIAATYLSPVQRDQLPEQLSYGEAEYIAKNIHSVRNLSEINADLDAMFNHINVRDKQEIREAQIPLLILMYANILVNEIPLFPKVEALYQPA